MEDLVKGLQAGDTGSFERFVQQYGDRLHRFIRRLVGPRWMEDVTQEVFLRIHRSIGTYRPGGSFNAWVYTLANNLCIDFLRRQRRAERNLQEPVNVAPTSGDVLAASEMRDAILRAVEQLPVEQRQVFLLREEAGLTSLALQ